MEGCASRDYSGLGFAAGHYLVKPEFRQTKNQILSGLASLGKKIIKEEFRKECLELTNFLIEKKDKPPRFTNPKSWVPVLRNYFKHKFDKITQHGGCPMIFDKKEKDLLELKYDALDFCEKNISYKNKLTAFKKGSNKYDCSNDTQCIQDCTEYETWFISKKEYFESNRNLVRESCTSKSSSSEFPTKQCNIMNSRMLNNIPKCLHKKPQEPTQAPPKEKVLTDPELYQVNAIDSPVSQDQSISQVEYLPDGASNSPSEGQSNSLSEDTHSDPPQLQTESEGNSETSLTNVTADTQSGHTEIAKDLKNLAPAEEKIRTSTVQPSTVQDTKTESITEPIMVSTKSLYPEAPSRSTADPKIYGNINYIYFHIFVITKQIYVCIYKFNSVPVDNSHNPYYALMGKFKKKKNIRRKVKFLRILLPSHSVKKDILLSDDHLDQTIHDDEEIIKKLKIHEHNTINNTNMLKRKKDRSKTIIEVHMEVLEEFRNEEWELKKGEFLAVCLEEYKYEKHRTYPNLINCDQMENIKCSNDIEEKKIIWNKWIEKHRNLSEKLKKEDWFNNLKNEWKKEKAMVNETEELNKKYLNENEKGSHLEREKDAWRGWISNRGKIVEHYLEQDWLKGLTNEFDNILDEYENEGTENSVSLINIEEMEHNKSCEELYKYIKKKLLSKLCVLVFMTILEECKKEKNVENKESYLDSSINECNSEKNLDRKYHIIENVVEKGNNVLENSENTEIFDYKEENNFTDEIKDWIGEDDIYVNSI
ncbi:STP1 protein [Plasmodium malariae]|uniref:STP1 protein n=1 Tax=Plasmodium malariae TaxID=5858 RepID=A0A1D3JHG0_PLAMA|nr:STP1 protein [Plasmodium malariae]SBT85766.1 STP1 protein [Plasmodium malariae]